jgi:hypothetical protein
MVTDQTYRNISRSCAMNRNSYIVYVSGITNKTCTEWKTSQCCTEVMYTRWTVDLEPFIMCIKCKCTVKIELFQLKYFFDLIYKLADVQRRWKNTHKWLLILMSIEVASPGARMSTLSKISAESNHFRCNNRWKHLNDLFQIPFV